MIIRNDKPHLGDALMCMAMMDSDDVYYGTPETNELFSYAGFKTVSHGHYDIDVTGIHGDLNDYDIVLGNKWDGRPRRFEMKPLSRRRKARRIGLACISRDSRRCYPHAKSLKRRLKRYGDVFELGHVQLEMSELIELVSSMDIMIATNNGIAHLAGCCNVPLVIMQGMYDCREIYGYYGNVRYVEGSYDKCFYCEKCRHVNCLYSIHPKDIIRQAFELDGIIIDTHTDNSTRGLGDIIMSTVIAKAFKENYPELPITYIVRKQAQCLADGVPMIDNVTDELPKDLKKKIYVKLGYAFEDYSLLRNRRNRIDSMLFYSGMSVKDKTPLVSKGMALRTRLRATNKVNVGVGITSASPFRELPPSKLDELAGLQKGTHIFHVFDTKFSNKSKNIVFHNLRLSEMPVAISQMDKMVCVDSMLSHLAGALNIPSIVLYTTVKASWRNEYYNSYGVQSLAPCSPCMDKQDIKGTCDGKCVEGFLPQMIGQYL